MLLHNDATNKRDYVVKVLMKCVEGMTVEKAYDIMSEAHEHGLALVLVAIQEEAENVCDKLRGNGLVATIEPEGKGGGDGN